MRKDVERILEKIKKKDLKLNTKELARKFNCDPRTVKKYLSGNVTSNRKPRMIPSKLDSFKDLIKDKLDKYSPTAMSIYQFICKKGYQGSYSLVKQFVRKHKNDQQQKATIRFESEPGIQSQVDWKERKTLYNRNKEAFTVNIFLMILGYSRTKYLELTLDRSQKTLFSCMKNAFKYFGGVSKEVLFDNMKTVVISHNISTNQVVFNQKLLQFSSDFDFKAKACQPYRPQTKGKVEALAKLTNRLDAYNEEFDTFEDLKEIVNNVRDDLNNEVSQATLEKPSERLKREQMHLLPLPSDAVTSYYQNQIKTYKVTKESLINFRNRKYSVPPFYIGKRITVELKRPDELVIFYEGIEISKHQITGNLINYSDKNYQEILRNNYPEWSKSSIEDEASKQLSRFDLFGSSHIF